MSSWFVWSSLGMYPVTPGAPVLALGAPIFPRVEMNLPHGRTVSISAPGASTSTYVRSLNVNGRSWNDDWLPSALVTGAQSGHHTGGHTTLAYTLGSTAGATWGTTAQEEPPSYPAGPLTFPPGREPVIMVPTGPNLLGTTPTGQLPWQGPVENGVGSVPGTLAAATTPAGASAVHWTETSADANTWVYVDPTPPLTAGQSYEVSVTLEGKGDVYLDFYNGQADLTSATIGLTSTPETLTLQGEVPTAADTHLQIRTADTGPVDLYASAASIRALTTQTGG
jgi:hypothetical protein